MRGPHTEHTIESGALFQQRRSSGRSIHFTDTSAPHSTPGQDHQVPTGPERVPEPSRESGLNVRLPDAGSHFPHPVIFPGCSRFVLNTWSRRTYAVEGNLVVCGFKAELEHRM
jgi:hypothetical protein